MNLVKEDANFNKCPTTVKEHVQDCFVWDEGYCSPYRLKGAFQSNFHFLQIDLFFKRFKIVHPIYYYRKMITNILVYDWQK